VSADPSSCRIERVNRVVGARDGLPVLDDDSFRWRMSSGARASSRTSPGSTSRSSVRPRSRTSQSTYADRRRRARAVLRRVVLALCDVVRRQAHRLAWALSIAPASHAAAVCRATPGTDARPGSASLRFSRRLDRRDASGVVRPIDADREDDPATADRDRQQRVDVDAALCELPGDPGGLAGPTGAGDAVLPVATTARQEGMIDFGRCAVRANKADQSNHRQSPYPGAN